MHTTILPICLLSLSKFNIIVTIVIIMISTSSSPSFYTTFSGVLSEAQEVEEEQRHHIVIPWTPPPPHPPYDQHSLTTLPNPLNHPTILSSLSLTHLGGGGRGSRSCPRRAKPRIISFQPIFSCPKPNPWVSNCSVAQFGKAHTLIWPSEKADRFRVQAKAKPSSLELFTSFSQKFHFRPLCANYWKEAESKRKHWWWFFQERRWADMPNVTFTFDCTDRPIGFYADLEFDCMVRFYFVFSFKSSWPVWWDFILDFYPRHLRLGGYIIGAGQIPPDWILTVWQKLSKESDGRLDRRLCPPSPVPASGPELVSGRLLQPHPSIPHQHNADSPGIPATRPPSIISNTS